MDQKEKDIRQRFFAFRNGIVADQLRAAGDPHEIVFGLMVPQLAEIARGTGADHALAGSLWSDRKCREARLLAAYLFEPEKVSQADAMALIEDLRNPEEADMLCFRLLKRLPFAQALVDSCSASDRPLKAYTAKILARHLA